MSLQIGKHIKASLEASEALKARVSNRIFPILYPIKDKQPVYPYIVYANNGIENEDTKACDVGQDNGTAEIIICAKSYKEMIEVADLARKALDNCENVEYPTFDVDDWDISSGNEDYDLTADCFFVSLNYQYVTTNK